MADGVPGWLLGILGSVDDTLRDVAKKARRILRMLRVLAALMVLLDLALVAGAILIFWRPEFTQAVLALAIGALLIPLLMLTFLAILPLRLKSVTRLIDKGYPANLRELAIRAVARKMRDQSIETEEMLVETAWNESKKAWRKYQARADTRDAPHSHQARPASTGTTPHDTADEEHRPGVNPSRSQGPPGSARP